MCEKLSVKWRFTKNVTYPISIGRGPDLHNTKHEVPTCLVLHRYCTYIGRGLRRSNIYLGADPFSPICTQVVL